MKNFLLSFSFFLIISCSNDSNYIDIANNQSKPLLQFDRIFDCREQNRTLWSTTHTELIVHFINFSKGSELIHRGSYKDTILDSPWDYQLSDKETDEHYYDVAYYDVEISEETESFIRFFTINKEGERRNYVINKETLTLSNTGIKDKVMKDKRILDGFKQQFINLNSIERPCREIT